jgi:TolB-like protein
MGARCSLSDFGSRQRSLRATGLPPVGSQHGLHAVAVASLRHRGDADQQYFADGITEDLTTDLSRIANMFVISSNTAFTYRNKPIDTKQIGHDLGVRYVLEGSVQRSGNRIMQGRRPVGTALKTVRCFACLAISGIAWMAVAPVPMMPTRLPVKSPACAATARGDRQGP